MASRRVWGQPTSEPFAVRKLGTTVDSRSIEWSEVGLGSPNLNGEDTDGGKRECEDRSESELHVVDVVGVWLVR
jgi:hypothetical protein